MPSHARKSLPRVLIIYTGGTIGMVPSGKKGTLSMPKLSSAELKSRLKLYVPELSGLAHCEVEVLFNRDSAHIGPADWVKLAETIQSRWKGYDGVVVLHGTDTLAYTASALSFLLRPCLKPVVITGAQRPLSAIRSDARRNLISAVEIATSGPAAVVRQVTVFFDDRLFQGNRVRKRSALEFEAFESPYASPLAVVGTTIEYMGSRRKPARAKVTRGQPEFSRKVAMIYATPGFPAEAVSAKLIPSLDALVLVVFPSGTAPTHEPAFLTMLKHARSRGVAVVVAAEGVSQASGHPVGPGLYVAGRALLREGCFWAGQMTPECAYVKTAWILGQPNGAKRFKSLWKTELADEGSR